MNRLSRGMMRNMAYEALDFYDIDSMLSEEEMVRDTEIGSKIELFQTSRKPAETGFFR